MARGLVRGGQIPVEIDAGNKVHKTRRKHDAGENKIAGYHLMPGGEDIYFVNL